MNQTITGLQNHTKQSAYSKVMFVLTVHKMIITGIPQFEVIALYRAKDNIILLQTINENALCFKFVWYYHELKQSNIKTTLVLKTIWNNPALVHLHL